MSGWIVAIVVAVAAAYAIYAYNALVRNRQMVKEGWSGISVQLKRRADLVPNLLASVKGYMAHEQKVFEDVTRLRARAQEVGDEHPAERAKAEGLFGAALGRLLAIAENYPELKANQNFLDFQAALQKIEDEIQLSRRYYNGAVRQFNTMVEQFPSNVVAGLFGFRVAEFFELDVAADREVPKVSFDRT
ncbi:MAG TPA: LemA family protein [Burkholderiaceae bacterium]|jgi:LemA protein|nr:LemA family protein [Burkholderiaceae bacterium]